jgi:carboxyl-terminal processing protease
VAKKGPLFNERGDTAEKRIIAPKVIWNSEAQANNEHLGNRKIKKNVEVIRQAFDIIMNNYYPSISPHSLLLGDVKELDNTVGPINLMSHEHNTPSVISPFTKKHLGSSITDEEGIDGLSEIFEYIADKNPDLSPIIITQSAIQGMIDSLDSHCSFLLPHEYKELFDTKRKFFGIGIEITMRHHQLTVVSPIQDTPAYKKGIKAGDHIVRIDGKETKDMTLMQAVKRMRGKRGTLLVLTIIREGFTKPKDFRIKRDVIPSQSVRFYPIEPGYGYLKITNFGATTFDDTQKAVNDLESHSTSLKGLILDLRNNPGGLLNQASKIADIFIKEGLIFSVKQRKSPHLRYLARATGKEHNYSIVVLINKGSAGASEILAGALKDNGRALVIGTPSFGKGSVQQISPLANGSALKYTLGYYATPSGHVFNGIGLMPQVLAGRSSDISKYILGENVLSAKNVFLNKGITSEVAVIYTDEFSGDGMLNTGLEILKKSGSSGLSAMLAWAEQMGGERHVASLSLQVNDQTREKSSESSLQDSSVGDLSGEPTIEIHNLKISPANVSAGSSFDLVVNYSVSDPSNQSNRIPVKFSFSILRSERVMFAPKPVELQALNGSKMSRIVTLTANEEHGIYELEAILKYKGKMKSDTTQFKIK